MIQEKILFVNEKEERIILLGSSSEILKIIISDGHFQVFKINTDTAVRIPEPKKKSSGFWSKKDKQLDDDLSNLEQIDNSNKFWQI